MIITKNPKDIALILQKGGIIAYPTEAVWGVGCDPFNKGAVKKILKIKNRAIGKGMILVAGNANQLIPWCENLSPELAKKLITPCDEAITWIVEDTNVAPSWLRGSFNSTAIRLSKHEGVKALCAAFNGPIVSTSANPSQQEPALSLNDVINYFADELDAIFDVSLGGAKQPSKIKELANEMIIRP